MNVKELQETLRKVDNPDMEVFVVDFNSGDTYKVKAAYQDQVYDNEIGQMAELPEGTWVLSVFITP